MKWIKRILGVLLLLLLVFIGVQYVQHLWGIQAVEAALPGNSQVVETRLGPVEYQIQGSSERYLLFIHGTPGSYRTFMANILMDEGFSVISPSRPGYFRTPLASGVSIDEQADLYAALLDALAIDSAAIVGFSGGGPSAIKFAARHPNRCSGLAVLASTGRAFEEPDRPFMQELVMGSEFGRWMGFSSMSGGFEQEATAEIALNYLQTAFFPMNQTEEGEQNDFKQFMTNWTGNLGSIQCPTLIIHGTEDELIPFTEATYLDQQILNSKLIAREGQDHFTVVFFEFDQNLKLAADFLNRAID